MPLILSLSIALFLMLLSGLYEVKKKTSYQTNSNINDSYCSLSNIFATFSLSPSLLLSFLYFFLSTVSLIEKKILIK